MKSKTEELNENTILNSIPIYPNYISGRELADAIGVEGTPQVRRHINSLRTAGFPIVSNKNGYSIATNTEQIWKCIQSLRSRITAIDGAIDGLYKSLGSIAQ